MVFRRTDKNKVCRREKNMEKQNFPGFAKAIAEQWSEFIISQKENRFKCGHNINWHRTVSRVSPFIQDEKPFYITQRTKLSRIDFEEELLCIYFSVLNYFKTVYKCKIQIDLDIKSSEGISSKDFSTEKG